MEREPNYGRHHEPGDDMDSETRGMGHGAATMSENDENTWSMLSHLSVLLAFVGLMPLGSLIVWLIYKDRSPRVGFHALQSLWYQVAWVAILIVGAFLGTIFSIVTLGIGLILILPIAFIAYLIPIIHGCYAAYKVNQGVDYRYPFIADKIDGGQRTV